MLPVMARTTEDILNLVPNELRESGLAIGAPRWRVTLGVVFKAAAAASSPARPGHRPGRRRDRAAALHGAEQPVLDDRAVRVRRLLRRPTANLTVTIYDFAGSPYSHGRSWPGAARC